MRDKPGGGGYGEQEIYPHFPIPPTSSLLMPAVQAMLCM